MHPCPSCAAPLDSEGICTSCGALTRGFFRDLDLGAPAVAEAVASGLDFYLLLGAAPEDDTRTIARRYRRLRVLFPDDPSGLAPEPARRLSLLERAGRVLTDPQLRRTYDALRGGGASVTNQVLRCVGCAAPLPSEASRCAFCGTSRPEESLPPAGPPESGPPPAEPVDYYAMLGLTAEHLIPMPPLVSGLDAGMSLADLMALDWRSSERSLMPPSAPPSAVDVDAAALARERQILLSPGYAAEEREQRVAEIEIARRTLRDETRRSRYDMLLLSFRQGLLDRGRLDGLRHLQDLARADMAEERGEQVSGEQAGALLRQGLGYLSARLPREAIKPLRRAVAALPDSAEAHEAYARAILSSDDPLGLGAHALRQALQSLSALERLGATDQRHAPLAALCRGLLARDAGDAALAERELQRATEADSRLAPAWRGLAALALGRGAFEQALAHCDRALAIDQRDERALTMAAAAGLRSGQPARARDAAAQIATLRGEGWTADAVLRQLEA
ncbi:MAG: molecular chaperone DnaJ [Kouleothrix sp.]|nr:molecular chaperone DnaJ [Kouleothrix sp.]